ncbi:MAG TPA: hypothetical protein GX731_02735 [Clostridiales bacterium]|nr:hypothetical protein [Clostridiales bacterium]
MKVRVLKTFRDKGTGSILRPNLIIDITEERVEELTSTLNPFIEVLEGEDGTQVNEREEIGEIDSIAFAKMKKEEIVRYAKEVMNIELSMEMTKAQMIELLEK